MKNFIKRIILIMLITIITCTTVNTVSFADDGTHANSATSFSSGNLKSVLPGDSRVWIYGRVAKVTLYIATTNVGISTNLENINVVTPNVNPLFVKFGESIFVTDSGTSLPYDAYANTVTCKVDQLIDYKNGTKIAPAFKKITNNDIVKINNFPDWLKTDLTTTNQPNLVAWVTDVANSDKTGANKYKNLRDLILTTAYKSDPSKEGDMNSVNNVLYTSMNKAKFDYRQGGVASGEQITLTAKKCMPGEDYAHWLIVYEPAVFYVQDPNKMFFPSGGGNSFLLSATDAILTNMYSSIPGYQSVVKFGYGTPAVTMHYNHCNLCDLTWFGYPDWNPKIPLATYCPLPCPGIGKDYSGVKTITRYPFAVTTPFRTAARTYTVQNSWLKYSGGHLFDKPTAPIDTLIASNADFDNVLHYGGYSLFVNGPVKQETVRPTVYIRAVAINKDYTFTTIPNVSIDLTTKDDINNPTVKAKTDEEANNFINAHPDAKSILTDKYSKIKSENFIQNITTISDYVSIPFYTDDNVDFTALLKNYKIIPKEIKGLTKSTPLSNFDIEKYIDKLNENNPNYNMMDLGDKIETHLHYLRSAADSAKRVAPDGTITLDDGTKIGPNEDIRPNFNKFIAYMSENNNLKSLDDLNESDVLFYDSELLQVYVPNNFTFTGKPVYITVILSIVTAEKIPDETIGDNIIRENELIKAVFSANPANMSTVSLKKTVNDTTCDGTDTEPCSHIDPKDPKKKLHAYDVVSCGHFHTLVNAKNITPKSLAVQPDWYWNSSMFSGLSRLAVLRPNGALVNDGKTFVFNNTSSFTATNMNDAFSELTDYKFLTHRNANNSPLQLAAFMSNTDLNKAFQNCITPYYGGAYPTAYSSPNGFFGGSENNIVTSSTLPSSVNAVGSGTFCSGGSSNSLSIPSKLTGEMQYGITTISDNTFKTETKVTVQPTVAQGSKTSPTLKTESVYWGLGDPDLSPAHFIRYESQPISFYPAFKMAYDMDNSGEISSQVWILGNGEKVFKGHDSFTYEILKSEMTVDAAWSRDAEDRWEDPKATQRVARTTPTIKSGGMFKTDSSGTILRITVNTHLQDPAFVPEAHRAALQSKNDQIIEGYDNAVKDIIAKLKNDGISYYSNLLQAATKETIHYIPSGNNVIDLSAKTTVRLAAPVDIRTNIFTSAAYIDNNGIADAPAGRTITVKGQNLTLKPWKDTNIIKSNAVLKDLLVENGGNTVSGWYTESYEGVIVLTRVYLLELTNLESGYTQVHPALSDSITPRNQLARRLAFLPDNRFTLIEAGQFGIGIEVRFPEINLGGMTHKPVLCGSPFLMDIRGSIYDN